jgi:hypothetical protein
MTSKKMLFLTAATFFGLLPFFAYAGRPLTIDDAAPVSEGHVEVELGYHFKNTIDERDHRLPVMTLAYGLTRNLEAGLGLQYIMKDPRPGGRREGFDDVHLAAKYRFLEQGPYIPSLAGALDVKIPIKGRRAGLSSGRFDQHFLLLATKSFGPLDLDVNAGYLLVDSPPGEKLRNGSSSEKFSVKPVKRKGRPTKPIFNSECAMRFCPRSLSTPPPAGACVLMEAGSRLHSVSHGLSR